MMDHFLWSPSTGNQAFSTWIFGDISNTNCNSGLLHRAELSLCLLLCDHRVAINWTFKVCLLSQKLAQESSQWLLFLGPAFLPFFLVEGAAFLALPSSSLHWGAHACWMLVWISELVDLLCSAHGRPRWEKAKSRTEHGIIFFAFTLGSILGSRKPFSVAQLILNTPLILAAL